MGCSKLIESKNSSKYSIRYLDDVLRPLVLILFKMSGYVKAFKDKTNKLLSFCTDDHEVLEKYKIIWTKIEVLKNIELNALPFYDDRYIKTKIWTNSDKVCTNFCGLNVPEDDAEFESSTNISIDY